MNDKIQLNELLSLNDDCSVVRKILSSGRHEKSIKKKILKYNLADRIGKIDKYGIDSVMLIPVLVGILNCENSRYFPALVSSIALEMGKIHADGLVTKYAFGDSVSGTRISSEEIPRELEKRGYLKDSYILPSFRPFDPNFTFDLDERYLPIKDKIKEALLAVSKGFQCTQALAKLAEADSYENVRSDIIFGLAELGHPASLPVLLNLAKKGNREAGVALIKIAFRDMSELEDLSVRGVLRDLWGEDLREKVLSPVSEIIPFLISVLQSGLYTKEERRSIAELYSMLDRRRESELDVFVKVLPELLDERIGSCPVSRVITAGGKDSIDILLRLVEESVQPQPVVQRVIEIFGLMGYEAANAISSLKRIPRKYTETGKLVEDTIRIIEKSEASRSLEENENKKQKAVQSESTLDNIRVSEAGPSYDEDIAELEELEDAEEMGDIIDSGAVEEAPSIKPEEKARSQTIASEGIERHEYSLEIIEEDSESSDAGSTEEGNNEIDALLAEIDKQEALDSGSARKSASDTSKPSDKPEYIGDSISTQPLEDIDDGILSLNGDEESIITYEEEIPELERELEELVAEEDVKLETAVNEEAELETTTDAVAELETEAKEDVELEISANEEAELETTTDTVVELETEAKEDVELETTENEEMVLEEAPVSEKGCTDDEGFYGDAGGEAVEYEEEIQELVISPGESGSEASNLSEQLDAIEAASLIDETGTYEEAVSTIGIIETVDESLEREESLSNTEADKILASLAAGQKEKQEPGEVNTKITGLVLEEVTEPVAGLEDVVKIQSELEEQAVYSQTKKPEDKGESKEKKTVSDDSLPDDFVLY